MPLFSRAEKLTCYVRETKRVLQSDCLSQIKIENFLLPSQILKQFSWFPYLQCFIVVFSFHFLVPMTHNYLIGECNDKNCGKATPVKRFIVLLSCTENTDIMWYAKVSQQNHSITQYEINNVEELMAFFRCLV